MVGEPFCKSERQEDKLSTKLTPTEVKYLFREYQEKTGHAEVDMTDLADYCIKQGIEPPRPESSRSLLAKQLSRAARQTTKVDDVTGHEVRAFHHVREKHGQTVLDLWRHIDDAPRNFMERSLKARDNQVVNSLVQMSFDAEYWNRNHPDEEPIPVNTDHTLPVEISKLAPMIEDEDID
jgi:hypothetical protein